MVLTSAGLGAGAEVVGAGAGAEVEGAGAGAEVVGAGAGAEVAGLGAGAWLVGAGWEAQAGNSNAAARITKSAIISQCLFKVFSSFQ